jgi:hypothetical protein
MKTFLLKHVLTAGTAASLLYGYASAAEVSLDSARTLAVVPVKNGNVDQKVYRQIDRVVPELKTIAKKKIVKLVYSYSGQPDREQEVENAYHLAARIEKYLRVRHNLDLDLWIAIDIRPKSVKSPPLLTLAVFSDDIRKLDAVLANPVKN